MDFMNITRHSQTGSPVIFQRWLFVTTISVAVSVFVTFLVFSFSYWSESFLYLLVFLTTSLLSSLMQLSMLSEISPSKIYLLFFSSLIGSSIGWAVYFLLLHPFILKTGVSVGQVVVSVDQAIVAILVGMFGGAVIGLFPGLFSSLVYWWLLRRFYHGANRIFLTNVVGWCLGISFGAAMVLIFFAIITSNSSPID